MLQQCCCCKTNKTPKPTDSCFPSHHAEVWTCVPSITWKISKPSGVWWFCLAFRLSHFHIFFELSFWKKKNHVCCFKPLYQSAALFLVLSLAFIQYFLIFNFSTSGNLHWWQLWFHVVTINTSKRVRVVKDCFTTSAVHREKTSQVQFQTYLQAQTHAETH